MVAVVAVVVQALGDGPAQDEGIRGAGPLPRTAGGYGRVPVCVLGWGWAPGSRGPRGVSVRKALQFLFPAKVGWRKSWQSPSMRVFFPHLCKRSLESVSSGEDRVPVEKLENRCLTCRGQTKRLVRPGADALLSPAGLLRSDPRGCLCLRHPPAVLLSSAWTK